MMFKVNHSEAGNTFDPVPAGDYEVIISDVEKKEFKTGSKGLALTLTIRDDVDQPAQKRKLFDNLVISEKALFRFNQYAAATSMPDGQEFSDEASIQNGFGQWLMGKSIRARVKHETQDGTTRERVNGVAESKLEAGELPSNSPFASGGNSNPFADSGKTIDISDDNLPF